MAKTIDTETQTGYSPAETQFPLKTAALFRVCLVGSKRILRAGISRLLGTGGIATESEFETPSEFADHLAASEAASWDAAVLILTGLRTFSAIHAIRDVLAKGGGEIPLVVLSEDASRGQIYAALRIGAKAYVDLDSEPEDLRRAVRLAAQGRVYLAPDAAELLVDDVSAAIDPTMSTHLPSTELSHREVEIVQLMCEGISSKEIGRRLHISGKTVENHRYNIYRKCEVGSLPGLMRYAVQKGLVSI